MRPKLGKNNLQWIFDYVIKTTGLSAHWEYSAGISTLPEVKQWDMFHKVWGKQAARTEEVARRAEEAGHYKTAWELYSRAVEDYYQAQHTIVEHGNSEKVRMYQRLLFCHEKVRKYSDHPIEKIEIPWGDKTIPALFHLAPDKKKAPCILYIPGMDQSKEGFPNARGTLLQINPFIERGMHALSIDGPGQGECYMRKIWVHPNNHCEAARAAIDYLLTRPEVDGDKIGLYGISMGSYWVAQIAAFDNRIKAASCAMGCFMMNRHTIFEEASPRFRLTFKFMAGIEDDDEFDSLVVNRMTVKGIGHKIKMPFLMQTGEFDPLSPLEESTAFFNEIAGPKEMWIMEDEFHGYPASPFCNIPFSYMHADWLKDKLDGKYPRDLAKKVLIPPRGMGQYT